MGEAQILLWETEEQRQGGFHIWVNFWEGEDIEEFKESE